MDISWLTFSPNITAAPLLAERRRVMVPAPTEGLQESWLQRGDGTPTAWRLVVSADPVQCVAVTMLVDGKPTRPGLAMRGRMALDSLFGSAYAPVLLTVKPVVDQATPSDQQRHLAEAGLRAFLQQHPDLDRSMAAAATLPR